MQPMDKECEVNWALQQIITNKAGRWWGHKYKYIYVIMQWIGNAASCTTHLIDATYSAGPCSQCASNVEPIDSTHVTGHESPLCNYYTIWHFIYIISTRMHSSRMCTARALTIGWGWRHLPGGVPTWGVYLPGGCTCQGGVPAKGVYSPRGMYLPRGCTCPGCTCLGRCTCPGRYLPRGVYLPGCVPARGEGTCPGGRVPAQEGCTCQGVYLPRYSPCEQNDRQVQKYYLAPNFVCGR